MSAKHRATRSRSGLVDVRDGRRFGLQDRLPRIDGCELVHQGRARACRRRVRRTGRTSHRPAAPPSRGRPPDRSASRKSTRLGGDLTDPRRERHLVLRPAVGSLAVPAFELLPDAVLHARPSPSRRASIEAASQTEVRTSVPCRMSPTTDLGDLRGAHESRAAAGGQRQSQHLAGVAEVRRLGCLTGHEFVAAVQACLEPTRSPYTRRGVAESGRWCVRRQPGERSAGERGRQQAGPQRGLRRLPHAEVGRDRQRSQQVGQA